MQPSSYTRVTREQIVGSVETRWRPSGRIGVDLLAGAVLVCGLVAGSLPAIAVGLILGAVARAIPGGTWYSCSVCGNRVERTSRMCPSCRCTFGPTSWQRMLRRRVW